MTVAPQSSAKKRAGRSPLRDAMSRGLQLSTFRASELGLTFPITLLARADEVIE